MDNEETNDITTEEEIKSAEEVTETEEDLDGDSSEPSIQIYNGEIQPQEIVEELTRSYIDYAMSVIVARALPDVRDGLKPVQRRILYAMQDMGVKPNTQYKKVARIVGEVLGKYHPHGDASVTDALVNMAQDWNKRYPLIDGQGNFGSIDDDPHAAMRYIEARLDKNASEILNDLDKNTVDFTDNFDGTEKEPVVLPALLPNLLVNGAEGIAVGMATKIPPHNLNEVIDATVLTIDKGDSTYEGAEEDKINYTEAIKTFSDLEKLPIKRFPQFVSNIEIPEILGFIQGPDFPTGGEIFDLAQIKQAYETGRGRILMRGISEIEETKGGRFQIIITELPYQVVKSRLISKIADLVKEGKIDGISGLKDLSNREGIRIVIELKRDAKPKSVQNQLYKYTELQKAFNTNMLALVEGEPQMLNIKQVLVEFVRHRQEVVIRRHEFELAKLRDREHILEGLMIALDNLDEVISTIRNSKDAEVAKTALITKFDLSDIQAQAILDMQLRKLAALERQKIEDEYKEVKARISDILTLLNSPKLLLELITKELKELKEKLGDKRRTRLNKGKVGEFSEEDLVPREDVFVTVSEQGYIKRIKTNAYEAQNRGGVGKKAMTTKEDDSVRHVFSCSTHDEIMLFTNKGKVFVLKVYEVPEYSSRAAKGVPVINLINIEQGEVVTSVLVRGSDGFIMDEEVLQEGEQKLESAGRSYKFLFMATRMGVVKKTEMQEFDNIRSNGLIAIKLDDNDELIWVKPTTGDDTIIIVSRQAKAIHFHEEDVRETGRATRGVRGITLKADNSVIAMDVVRKLEDRILTLFENGFGKVTPLSQFPVQKRGGTGVFAAQASGKTGDLVVARIIDHPAKELLIMSKNGQAIRVPVSDLPERNRQTQGVRMMRLREDDTVAAIAII